MRAFCLFRKPTRKANGLILHFEIGYDEARVANIYEMQERAFGPWQVAAEKNRFRPTMQKSAHPWETAGSMPDVSTR